MRLALPLDGLCFLEEQRNSARGGSLMNLVAVESPIGLDRLATWDEVRSAMSFSSQGAFELVGTCDDCRELDSDFAGRACNLSEDIMCLAIVSEMPDSMSN
jgi:hypothetical protein